MTNSFRVRMVVADVDGTVLNTRKEITPEALSVVREMQDAGVQVVFCSGRAPFAMREIVEAFGLTGPTGALSGAIMLDEKWNIAHKLALPEKSARHAMLRAFENGIDVWLYTENDWYVLDRYGPRVQREVDAVRSEPHVVASFDEYFPQVVKLLGISDDEDALLQFQHLLENEFDGLASAVRTQTFYLEITHPHATKGEFVRELCRRYDIAKDEVVSIGDAPADAMMFEHSGLGIAMGNALDEVKQVAGAITATCDEDGFAQAMRAHVLASIAQK